MITYGCDKNMKNKIVQSQTLQNQVYEYLHTKIINGEIPPGQRLVEEKIVEETGISRSPIREAIRRLASDGLVSVSPRGGVKVYRATSEDFNYLYECRLSLEPTAAYYAALRINQMQLIQLNKLMEEMKLAVEKRELDQLKILSSRFHHMILEASGNPYLAKVMKQLNSLITFYRNAVLNIPRRLEDGADEHRAIWRAIQNRDGESAEKLMKEHIQLDYRFYMAEYRQKKEAVYKDKLD
ncbi:GntR family transcriptional regulator [Priestia megaterium]|uniref:GntR family transcriptional regulator n=1 Tax=Priestia megaterium TaxID=1404 RepID=UPI0027958494|nr:GntR family transcriptional regulator [Priestia megaterium]